MPIECARAHHALVIPALPHSGRRAGRGGYGPPSPETVKCAVLKLLEVLGANPAAARQIVERLKEEGQACAARRQQESAATPACAEEAGEQPGVQVQPPCLGADRDVVDGRDAVAAAPCEPARHQGSSTGATVGVRSRKAFNPPCASGEWGAGAQNSLPREYISTFATGTAGRKATFSLSAGAVPAFPPLAVQGAD